MTTLQGTTRTPSSIEAFLLRRGGLNPYRQPMYRLVRAEEVYTPKGGIWHDWDESLTLAERGGTVRNEQGERVGSSHRPDRVITEVRDVQKYLFLGWVLEKWMPSSMYGSPGEWYARVVPRTNLPLLGPFPERGDYEHAAGPWAEEPAIELLSDQMLEIEARRMEHKGTIQAQIMTRCQEAEIEYYERLEKERKRAQQRIHDLQPILLGSSLEAGRAREALGRKAGLAEHVGN